MNNDKVRDFYNDFVDYQTHSGINERIYALYQKMKSLGLKSDSKVLELGCGIGVMTDLLSKTVKDGYIEAVDLSNKSVEYAKTKVVKSNISFCTGDVVKYKPTKPKFDFITLFDVIEHIPIEKHPELFENLAKIATDETKIIINIPNPDFIEYLREHEASTLQIIDQPVPLSSISENAEHCGLQIFSFNTYSIWVENDYQWMIIRKKKLYQKNLTHEKRTLAEKIKHKLHHFYIHFRYGR